MTTRDWRRYFLAALVVGLIGADAAPAAGSRQRSRELPAPSALSPQINFWKQIFARYSRHHVVIHDTVYLDKVYKILDFREVAKSQGEAVAARLKREGAKREVEKVRATLQALHRRNGKVGNLGPEERRIWALYRNVSGRNKFREAAARDRLRWQSGLRERFQSGLQVSRRYLAEMEVILRDEGVPVELSRLPLVESTFNLDAYSKAGAAGIWQFMPSTGRLFLQIDAFLDERRDPLISTRAAARFLKQNYERLGTWPLAITAYNHGPAGVARAVKRVGTRDIATIIRRYKGKRFGFASRNFYTEFIAAVEVDAALRHHFGNIRMEPPLRYDEVELSDFVPLRSAAHCAGTTTDEIVALNPSFLEHIRDGLAYVPKGHRLRIPVGTTAAFQRRYAALGSSAKADHQKAVFVAHRVSRGQTLGGIARRYRTTIPLLQQVNSLKNPRYIRVGQVLQVPLNARARHAGRAIRGRTAVEAGPGSVTHTVKPGQTLSQIAHVLGTTVAALKKLNDLGDPRRLQAGRTLVVAASTTGRQAGESGFLLHEVRSGQTLGHIALQYRTTVTSLTELNSLKDPRSLRVGQVLRVPPT